MVFKNGEKKILYKPRLIMERIRCLIVFFEQLKTKVFLPGLRNTKLIHIVWSMFLHNAVKRSAIKGKNIFSFNACHLPSNTWFFN